MRAFVLAGAAIWAFLAVRVAFGWQPPAWTAALAFLNLALYGVSVARS